MGKMILITTDNEVKELEYPDGGLKSWKKLREHIGNGCELIEHVQPKRLYTEIGAGIEIKNVPGSKVSMLVDEEFYFHCDETKLNKIASWLYETDRHGYPILGNALIIGEKYGNVPYISNNEGTMQVGKTIEFHSTDNYPEESDGKLYVEDGVLYFCDKTGTVKTIQMQEVSNNGDENTGITG